MAFEWSTRVWVYRVATEFHKTNMINLLGMTRRFSSIFQKTETRHVPILCNSRWHDVVFAVLNDFHTYMYFVSHALINVYTTTGTHMCDIEVFPLNIEHNSYICYIWSSRQNHCSKWFKIKVLPWSCFALSVYTAESLQGIH